MSRLDPKVAAEHAFKFGCFFASFCEIVGDLEKGVDPVTAIKGGVKSAKRRIAGKPPKAKRVKSGAQEARVIDVEIIGEEPHG